MNLAEAIREVEIFETSDRMAESPRERERIRDALRAGVSADAIRQIRAYRENHRIDLSLVTHGETLCAHDRIKVIPRRGGWRHDPSAIARLEHLTRGYA